MQRRARVPQPPVERVFSLAVDRSDDVTCADLNVRFGLALRVRAKGRAMLIDRAGRSCNIARDRRHAAEASDDFGARLNPKAEFVVAAAALIDHPDRQVARRNDVERGVPGRRGICIIYVLMIGWKRVSGRFHRTQRIPREDAIQIQRRRCEDRRVGSAAGRAVS